MEPNCRGERSLAPGVDPVWWVFYPLMQRSPLCLDRVVPIQPSFASRWSNWFAQATRRVPWPKSSSLLPRALYPVTTLCRVLGVSSSGYYAWRKRPPSVRSQADARLQAHIEAIHAWSDGTYGTPRILAQLRQEGVHVSGKRVARLLRQAGLQGVSRRPQATTTRQAKDRRPAPDLVNRDFSAVGPDQLWVADITYVPTWAGFIYLAVVLDAFSRRIIGWAIRAHLGTELVLDALNMALAQRRPKDDFASRNGQPRARRYGPRRRGDVGGQRN